MDKVTKEKLKNAVDQAKKEGYGVKDMVNEASKESKNLMPGGLNRKQRKQLEKMLKKV